MRGKERRGQPSLPAATFGLCKDHVVLYSCRVSLHSILSSCQIGGLVLLLNCLVLIKCTLSSGLSISFGEIVLVVELCICVLK
jgi:hypothetical protein